MNEENNDNQLNPSNQPLNQNHPIPNPAQSPIRSTTVHPTITSSVIPLKQSNDTSFAEIVSLEMINKLITLIAREKYAEEIDSRIPQICCDFVIDSIKPCLQQESIAYDQCEHQQRNEEVFFNNCFIDTNTWEEIGEPPRPFIEREASTLMTMKKATDEEELKYDTSPRRASLLIQSNIPTEASVQAEDDKTIGGNKHKKFSNKFKVSKKLVLKIKDKDTINENDTSKHSNKTPSRNHLTLSNNTKVSKGRRGKGANNTEDDDNEESYIERSDGIDRNKMIELESHDLPKKLFDHMKLTEEELLDLEELRRGRILDIARKEEEERRRIEQEKKDYYASIAVTKHVKEFESNRYTFDSNGRVIPLRQPRIDSFASEFWWSKLIIKDGPTFPNEMPKEKPASSPQKKAQDDSKVDKLDKPIVDKRNSSRVLKPLKEKNDYNENQIVRSTNLDPFKINYSRFANIRNNQPVTPAGSNMNIMIPEVGVIISDGHLRKEGKMEFSAKFNRLSMDEFSRIALDSNNWNNQSKQHLMTSLGSQRGVDDSNSYIGYAEKFPSANNPLAKNSLMSRNFSAIGTRNGRQMHNRSSDVPLETEPSKQLYNSSRNNETIALNDKLQTTLKAAIDMVDEDLMLVNHNYVLTETNQMNNLPNVQTLDDIRDMFKDGKARKRISFRDSIKEEGTQGNRNIIDSFNSNIVKSKDWGYSNVAEHRNNYFRKPVKSNYIKELGYQIVSTKLPRSRRLEASIKSGQ